MSKERFFRLLRFMFGAVLNFSAKVLLVSFFIHSLGMPQYINYLLTHMVILLISYAYHSSVAFNVEMSRNSFLDFTKCVLGLKVVDYLIFCIAVYLFGQFYLYAIVLSSSLIFSIRFLLLENYVFHRGPDDV